MKKTTTIKDVAMRGISACCKSTDFFCHTDLGYEL